MERNGSRRFFTGLVLVFLLSTALSAASYAQVPRTISHQGYLTNSAGHSIKSPPDIQMTFRIYDTDTGGAALWTEVHGAVTVHKGIYSIVLGSVDPSGNPLDLPFDEQYYLGVEIGSDGEMTPRQALTSVPSAFYSIMSDSAVHADSADSAVDADALEGQAAADFAASSHNHAASEITSGTLSDSRIASNVARDSEIVPEVLANDGSGSGLDADMLDGQHAAAFSLSDHAHTLLDADTVDGLHAASFLRSDTSDVFTGGQITFDPGTSLLTSGDLNFTGANLVVSLGDSDPDRVRITGDLHTIFGSNTTAILDSSTAILTLGHGTASTAGEAGDLVVKADNGSTSAWIDGDTGMLYLGYGSASTPGHEGEIIIDDDNGEPSIRMDGGNSTLYVGYGSGGTPGDGGMINVYNDTGTRTSYVSGQSGQFYGRTMLLEESNNDNVMSATSSGVHVGDSQSPNDVDLKVWDPSIEDEALWFNASAAALYLGSGSATTTGDDGDIYIRDSSGTTTISMDGHTGRTTTKILTITGGSDLSEQFEVKGIHEKVRPEPGMVVCIDSEHPGELVVSSRAYDRTVAGVLSGAGGIQTGMLMGQTGTEADGKYPVALTGRVYVKADASCGNIRPGDLLTTAETPGHVMKVADYTKAQGATIGKAMSPLSEGQGLVLVLVALQ